MKMSNDIWLNEFNQANIWEILSREGDTGSVAGRSLGGRESTHRLLCRLPFINRERWFTPRDAMGFWVWWQEQRYYIYERKGSRVQIKIEINGIGENLWVNASETKPLTFEENLEFAAEVMQRCLTAGRLVA
jgi:hypothetical protein